MKPHMHKITPASNWKQVMRHLTFAGILLVTSTSLQAQAPSSPDLSQIEAVTACIHAFASAADAQDLKGLEKILHPSYRTILNKAFGSDEVTVLSKDDYIGMAKAGKIGGAERELHILSLDIQDEIARATVVLQSETTRFNSYFSMVRNAKGEWQMIADLPQIEKLN